MTDKKDIRSILGKRSEPSQGTLFDKEALGKINTNFEKWKESSVRDDDKKNWQITPQTTLGSNIPRNLIYTPLDIAITYRRPVF